MDLRHIHSPAAGPRSGRGFRACAMQSRSHGKLPVCDPWADTHPQGMGIARGLMRPSWTHAGRTSATASGASSVAAGRRAKQTAAEQRALQKDQAKRRRKAKAKQGRKKDVVHSRDQKQPEPKMPEQHLEKPGLESDVRPRPEYQAPTYRGSGRLQDQVALITGGDSGIGRAVAVLYAREGADIAIVYLSEDSDAEETRQAVEAEGRRCLL